MARFVAMVVVSVMLVLVVAEAFEPQPPPDTPANPPSQPPQDDCDKLCDEKYCSIFKDFKDQYTVCLEGCRKLICNPPLSPLILGCTSACADMMSSKFTSAQGKGEYIQTCYNMCNKNV
ncbi:hypothetical protein CJ030_MR4G021203 [Morella rubra]|uniref:Uncharacterized protein n=1 Tax=Morella rubra TaxID=262757 RepID=A0A6A1VZY4_9ROSI|nr:hypothetical protein CJ030_MR4G021203 [Morella rubra]